MSTGDGSAAACDRLRKRIKELELEVSHLKGLNKVVETGELPPENKNPDDLIDMVAVLSSGGVKSV